MVDPITLNTVLLIQLTILPFQLVLFYGTLSNRKRLKLERQRLIHQVRISKGIGGVRRWH